MSYDQIIKKEIRRLSLLIAIDRLEINESISQGMNINILHPVMISLCENYYQRKALIDGHFEKLPYNIKLLYNEKT